MTDHERPRPITEVAATIVDSLKAMPFLLALMLLNVMGIGAAVWFLGKLADAQGRRMEQIMTACFPAVK